MNSMGSLTTSPSTTSRSSSAVSPSSTLVHPVTPTYLSIPSHPVGPRSAHRPATITELAERALHHVWDPTKNLKHYLRIAQQSRDAGKEYVRAGDLESAFVEFARAATIVLEKLPSHRDYTVLLNSAQRHNLGLNGQDILDNLSKLKPTLVERHDRWLAQQSNPKAQSPQLYYDGSSEDVGRRSRGDPFPVKEEDHTTLSRDAREREREEQRRDEQTREETRWRATDETRGRDSDEERRRRDRYEASRRAQADESARRQQDEARWREDEMRARSAAERQRDTGNRAREGLEHSAGYNARAADSDEARARLEGLRLGDQHPQPTPIEDRRRLEERRRQEADGILRRQQEAEAAAHATRNHIASISGSSTATVPNGFSSTRHDYEQDGIARRQREADAAARQGRDVNASLSPLPNSAPGSMNTSYHPPSAARQGRDVNASLSPLPNSASGAMNPSHQPVTFQDREGIVHRQREAELAARGARQSAASASSSVLPAPMAKNGAPYSFLESHHREGIPIMPLESPTKFDDDSSTDVSSTNEGPSARRNSTRRDKRPEQLTPSKPKRSSSYPIPVTTTSPPPPDLGPIRYPSLMTTHQMNQGYTPSLQSMFMQSAGPSVSTPLLFDPQPAAYQQPGSRASATPSPYGVSYPQPPIQQHQPHGHHQSTNAPSSSRPPPQPTPSAHYGPERITRADSRADNTVKELKTVNFPRDCLPRFLSIAAANTAKNRETCGLLLGKDKGHKFVVSTLLIPKQHATSDTCAMDEEELVLEFMEERNLITLGWIHTHPTQSCFMSSVDLHTHSGFQRMLPESFAVVCAPTSTPNFGIFRLTDPPGLQTLLDCRAKEAFHPHPDLPIYTDADKGHVQMKDIGLEIVDLR